MNRLASCDDITEQGQLFTRRTKVFNVHACAENSNWNQTRPHLQETVNAVFFFSAPLIKSNNLANFLSQPHLDFAVFACKTCTAGVYELPSQHRADGTQARPHAWRRRTGRNKRIFLQIFFFRSFITNKAAQVSFFSRRAHTDGRQQNVHEAVRLDTPRDLKPLMNFHSANFFFWIASK